MRKLLPKSRFEDINDWANYVLWSVDEDAVAKALDELGWMIVLKPEYDDGHRWPMNEPSADCPVWADNGDDPPQTTPRLELRVIDGGKQDDEGDQ